VGRDGPDKWASHKPRKQWADIGPKWFARYRPRIFFNFWGRAGPAQTLGLGQHWPDPKAMLIIYKTWTVVHVLHATEMVTENRGRRRSSSLEAGVSAVIKRLSWWFLRRFCEKWWSESFTGRRGRLLKSEREEETMAISGVGVAGLWLG